jgi:cytochrome P450
VKVQVDKLVDGHRKGIKPDVDHRTIFNDLLESRLPEEDKTPRRLLDEALNLVGAGAITVSHVLKVTTFYLLNDNKVLAKLRAELKSVYGQTQHIPNVVELEALPYLQAVVKEGLRLSYGVSYRSTRISPTAPLVYKDRVIPPGTPVSMTSVYAHQDPELFADPFDFVPERWMEPESSVLEKLLANFGSGSRSCLGMNLAYVEMFLALATVIHRFDIELYETMKEDVEMKHDFFSPLPKLNSKGVRVIAK